MADNCDSERDANRLVSTPVSICHVGAQKRNKVNPELIECTDTGRSTLTFSESPRLIGKASSRIGTIRQFLLDEIGDW